MIRERIRHGDGCRESLGFDFQSFSLARVWSATPVCKAKSSILGPLALYSFAFVQCPYESMHALHFSKLEMFASLQADRRHRWTQNPKHHALDRQEYGLPKGWEHEIEEEGDLSETQRCWVFHFLFHYGCIALYYPNITPTCYDITGLRNPKLEDCLIH